MVDLIKLYNDTANECEYREKVAEELKKEIESISVEELANKIAKASANPHKKIYEITLKFDF